MIYGASNTINKTNSQSRCLEVKHHLFWDGVCSTSLALKIVSILMQEIHSKTVKFELTSFELKLQKL